MMATRLRIAERPSARDGDQPVSVTRPVYIAHGIDGFTQGMRQKAQVPLTQCDSAGEGSGSMVRRSGRAKIIDHLRDHVGEWVHNQELRAVSGIDDVPRAIRDLKQQGWQIEDDGRGSNRLSKGEKGQPRGARRSVSERVRYQVLQASGFRCRACGRSVDDGVKLVVDHLLPVDWGGTNDPLNLQALCEECNHGKQAWVVDQPADAMRAVFAEPTVPRRIEALFDMLPDQDVSSSVIQMVSRNAFDWQRALRRVRERTGKRIEPVAGRTAYRYMRSDPPSGV